MLLGELGYNLHMGRVIDFYTKGQYFKNNPTWDTADTDWKFGRLSSKLKHCLNKEGAHVLEVGCGSGKLLHKLAANMPEHHFHGWDISPDAQHFWDSYQQGNLQLNVGDYLERDADRKANVALLVDVLEHVADPLSFLEKLRNRVDYVVIHLPLDMNIVNVLFDRRLLVLRDSIGHIHYFTKALAEKMLVEAGYEIVSSDYSNAWKDSPNLRLLGRIGKVLRTVLHFISPTLNAKLLGGETLILVAKTKE